MIPDVNLGIVPRSPIVLCSLANGGSYRILMDIMSKTVNHYAEKYGMDTALLKLDNRLAADRPEAWDKVVLLKHLLNFYETVIWLDADTLIINPDTDIRQEFNDSCAMQLATHLYAPHFYPNTGVWVVHRNSRATELLEAVWAQADLMHDVWWEQAAFIRLLGYRDPHDPNSYSGPTTFSSMVSPLDLKWNTQLTLDPLPTNPSILHYAGFPSPEHRLRRMRMDYETFLRRIS